MRRRPNPAALLLLAIAALPAAAAEKQQTFYTITLQSGRVGAEGKAEQISVQSIEWSASPAGSIPPGDIRRLATVGHATEASPQKVTKVDSFTIKQKVKPARPVGTSDVTMKRGTSSAKERPGPSEVQSDTDRTRTSGGYVLTSPRHAAGATGANETLTIGANRTEADPPPQGTLRVKLRFPWLACEEGKFIPQLIMGKPVKVYTLHDVVVIGCTSDSATFSYAKVEFDRTKPH